MMADEAALKAFGKRIAYERLNRGWSQGKVGAKLDEGLRVSHQSVANWEDGEAEPIRPRVASLERVFDLEPGTLSVILGYLPEPDDLSGPERIARIERRLEKVEAALRRLRGRR